MDVPFVEKNPQSNAGDDQCDFELPNVGGSADRVYFPEQSTIMLEVMW